MTISGPGAANLFISGNNASSVFVVNGVTATISGVTIENGHNGATTFPCTGTGGGIYNNGALTVSNSTLSGNSACAGGGIYSDTGGTLTIRNSTLSGNSASEGGGILAAGPLTTISNSTLSSNAGNAGFGGAVYSTGAQTAISNSTLDSNSSGIGGAAGTVTLRGTLLVNEFVPTGNGNCYNGFGQYGRIVSKGYNLSDDSTCNSFFTSTGDQNNVTTAKNYLGSLTNNGGPTST